MYSYNRVHIVGYQTQPVEVRQTPSGASVTDLNIVVPYTFRNENGDMLQGKGFHTVTIWGAMADVAGQYLKPGAQVFISGRLQTDSWDDQQSGEKRSKTKVVAMDMILLDPKDGQHPAPDGAKEVGGSVNRVDIVGNCTRDPEMRTTTSGQQVLSLGVATNDRWKDKASGEDRERAEFHNVVVWGDLAEEVNRHIRKGNRVYVSGRVQTRSWEAKDGSKRYTTEVIAESVRMLGVQNASAMESVSASSVAAGTSAAMASVAPVASEASAPVEEAPVAVPAVEYSSEVKVEDLPF